MKKRPRDILWIGSEVDLSRIPTVSELCLKIYKRNVRIKLITDLDTKPTMHKTYHWKYLLKRRMRVDITTLPVVEAWLEDDYNIQYRNIIVDSPLDSRYCYIKIKHIINRVFTYKGE